MGFTNIKTYQKELNKFIEHDVPQDFIRRQIDCAIYLMNEIIDLSFDVHNSEWSTQHSLRNWQISIDNEPQKELGTSLRSWQPGSEKSDAVPLSEDALRGSLSGRYKIDYGNKFKSMSTVWVFNKASRITKSGDHFYYMQELEDGHSDLIPRSFMKIAIAHTRVHMARLADLKFAFKGQR